MPDVERGFPVIVNEINSVQMPSRSTLADLVELSNAMKHDNNDDNVLNSEDLKKWWKKHPDERDIVRLKLPVSNQSVGGVRFLMESLEMCERLLRLLSEPTSRKCAATLIDATLKSAESVSATLTDDELSLNINDSDAVEKLRWRWFAPLKSYRTDWTTEVASMLENVRLLRKRVPGIAALWQLDDSDDDKTWLLRMAFDDRVVAKH